jgi:hypothetical protein
MFLDILTKDKRLKGGAISLVALVLGYFGIESDAANILLVGGALYQVIGWVHLAIRNLKTQGKAV